MKRIITLILLLVPMHVQGSGLKVSTPILYMDSEGPYAVLNVSWDNAWNNETNNDGVWLFFKSILEDGYRHISVLNEGHTTVAVFTDVNPELGFEAMSDGAGVYIYPAIPFRGSISATLRIALNPESFRGFNTRGASFLAYGIEMVSIPQGGFQIGSLDTTSLDYGAFYKPNGDGGFGGIVTIESESESFSVGSSGDVYYRAKGGYEGDQAGEVPNAFPKGVAPFIIMKYEPTEGQYADFLNSLSQAQKAERVIHNEDGYTELGGTIILKEGMFYSLIPNKPSMFMSWADAMAYADWAGLRPMTELEFTKAARGTSSPEEGDFPWGTNTKDQVQRFPNEKGKYVMLNGWEESDLTDENKKYFGASYYWVMDLAGSLWERVVSIGHEKGRSFMGSHGDGLLSANGTATNADWPIGDEESGGVGFRGGGFYGFDREYHEFNPFSPVSYRPYGGWHGTMRTHSYGARFVRSLE